MTIRLRPDGARCERRSRSRSFAMPSAYTILFTLIVLMAVSTWIIPAGTYDYNEDGEPVPGHTTRSTHEPPEDSPGLDQGADQRHVRHPG